MRGLRISVLMAALLALLLITACAKPPEAEKGAAKSAMEAATNAQADKYAKDAFAEAKKLWDEAETQMGGKKYKEAKKAYEEAKVAFEKAAAGVEAGKKALTEEVTGALTALEEAWKAVDATGKKVAAKLAADLKTAWSEDAKKVEEGLKALKDQIGADPLGAKEKVAELKAAVEKWEGQFKEAALAPAAKEPKKK